MTTADLPLSQDVFRTREEIVADAMRTAILRGTFKPGEKLDQQDLADRLQVSRSPIREALRTLAAEDLVTNIPHRGAVVTERSVDELEELIYMRCLLEGAAVRRAAPAMDEARLARLNAIIVEAEQSDDLEHVLGLNNDFHTTVYEAFSQPHLLASIQQLRNKVAPYNRLYLGVEGRKASAWADHRRIYAACVARDADSAETETHKHLMQVLDGIRIATNLN